MVLQEINLFTILKNKELIYYILGNSLFITIFAMVYQVYLTIILKLFVTSAIMKNFIIVGIALLLSGSLFAQSWKVLPNSPLAPAWNHDDIFFINDSTGWLCNSGGEIWKTTDGGDNWILVKDNPGTYFRCLAFIDSLNGFCGNLGPGGWFPASDPTLLYQTTDGGLNWAAVTTIPTTDNPKGICGIQAIDDQNIYAVGRFDGPAIFYKSTDGGATWTTKVIAGAKGLSDLHFFNPDTGLIGGRTNDSSIVLYTTDGGNNFTTVATADRDHLWKFYFTDRMNGYASISNYEKIPNPYLYTKDGGLTWTRNTFGTGNPVYEALGIGFFNDSLGWCGGDMPTYETKDGGATFKEIFIDPVYNDVINRMIRVSPTTMYAAGARVYKYTTTNVGVRTVPYIDNSKCTMSCNPNPITGTSQIVYTVPEDDYVLLTVVSIGGRLIETLVAEKQKAGTYTIDYYPKYKQKFVTCTIRTGRYRRSLNILREDL
ncbi:MAG: hypothetical protein IH948_08335 [Bacteroidetes bacterium]|nr:hypothetical protein [Bacteroidota bacterium]